ncbi:uncharacterized protein EV154DRAFT_571862 [Mucor mucedo]|uniref:uncharacterized protein n=1 Tax=Mucor mucedo TaxID=29922 RepID=UPI002220DE2A|nr:uncharacterized protein EV154DRAFT_571862 [Mucor mucedo]KAI7866918.1 hypothetical protein EV154DRAFT_571862 [Mucor mucedo]
MINLPQEILISITSLLTTRDKLNCIRVCKSWYNIIASSNLYDKLEVKNDSVFDIQAAVDMFRKKKYVGDTVKNLNIKWPSLKHSDILVSFPKLFPNVRTLHVDEEFYNARQFPSPEEFDYAETFKCWNKLETLIDRSEYLVFTEHIFKHSNLNTLKRLDIATVDMYAREESDNILKILRDNIHCIPALQELSLVNPTIRLEDMEVLHDSIRNLKKLILNINCFHNLWLQERAVSVSTQASQLKSLTLYIYPNSIRDDQENLDESVRKWISYIGQKYKNLQYLMIETYSQRTYNHYLSTTMEYAAMNMLSALRYIKYLGIDLCPLTKRITSIMEYNRIQLNGMVLHLNDTPQNEQMIDSLRPSQLINKVVKLTIRISALVIRRMNEPSYLKSRAIKLPELFINVVDLTVYWIPEGCATMLLSNLIQSFPVLQKLETGLVDFGVSESELANSYHIKECNTLESICFNLRAGPHQKRTNRFEFNSSFQALFQACPQIETVQITGELNGVSDEHDKELTLCFSKNIKLKQVYIRLVRCDGYSINGSLVERKEASKYPFDEQLHHLNLVIHEPSYVTVWAWFPNPFSF